MSYKWKLRLHWNTWANDLSIDKTNTVKFNSKHYQDKTFLINSQNNSINNNNTKFLGLELDKHINWKNHIYKNVPKMSNACFVGRSVYSDSNMSTLKMSILPCYNGI
jgi:hypothetical protein